MGKHIIIGVLIGVACWVVIALIAMLRFDMTFVQGLLRPYSIFLAAVAAAGSIVGAIRKNK